MTDAGLDLPTEAIHLFLTAVAGLCTILLAMVGYFLRAVARNQEKFADKITALEKQVAILNDRDRRKRLADYEAEESSRG